MQASLGLVAALVLTACSATYDLHGYVPPTEQLAEVDIGDSRDTVAELVGTPGAAGVMRDEAWFYSAYRVRNYAYRAPEVVEREILALSFDQSGRVQNIERFGLEDGQVVQLSRRVTTSTVRENTFLRQLLTNFGRIQIGDD
jgi:outer membrane protein assembly factor BamE (lipoprotein component of BamABCDE complex)